MVAEMCNLLLFLGDGMIVAVFSAVFVLQCWRWWDIHWNLGPTQWYFPTKFKSRAKIWWFDQYPTIFLGGWIASSPMFPHFLFGGRDDPKNGTSNCSHGTQAAALGHPHAARNLKSLGAAKEEEPGIESWSTVMIYHGEWRLTIGKMVD